MQKYRIEIKWALIFVLMTLVWMLLEKLAGLHSTHIDKHPLYTNLIAFPAILIYVLALLEKRKKFYHGKMNYVQGLLTGIGVTIIVAILSPLTQYIVSTVITPEYFPNMIEYSVSEGMLTEEAARKQFTLRTYIVQGFIGALVMGLITSAIVAIFTRKQ